MRNFFHFLQYHNAVPLAIGILILGGGATFAATDPQAIYSQQQTVLSIDNTYIANKDLSNWTPQAVITAVTEDDENYYINYTLTTIDLVNSVWQDTQKQNTMTVSKADLGPYRDLGVYVTQQLKQVVDREHQRLADTQEFEKRNVTQKTVATIYGGLIGKMLDANTETLPGYTPVVAPPEGNTAQVASAGAAAGGAPQSGSASSSGAPILQMLGNDPSYLALGSSYMDLGAVITDQHYAQYGIHVFKNGTEVPYVSIDTSTTSETTIRYAVFTGTAYVGDVQRTVVVYDPNNPPTFIPNRNVFVPPPPIQADATTADSSTASTTPPADSSSSASTTPPETASATTSTDTSSSAPSDTVSADAASTTPPVDTSANSTPPVDTSATSSATTTP